MTDEGHAGITNHAREWRNDGNAKKVFRSSIAYVLKQETGHGSANTERCCRHDGRPGPRAVWGCWRCCITARHYLEWRQTWATEGIRLCFPFLVGDATKLLDRGSLWREMVSNNTRSPLLLVAVLLCCLLCCGSEGSVFHTDI